MTIKILSKGFVYFEKVDTYVNLALIQCLHESDADALSMFKYSAIIVKMPMRQTCCAKRSTSERYTCEHMCGYM